MERHVDTWQRDGREASLQLDVALGFAELLSLCVARVNDLAEHLLHLIDAELLRQLQTL